jgi:hypothetical protein
MAVSDLQSILGMILPRIRLQTQTMNVSSKVTWHAICPKKKVFSPFKQNDDVDPSKETDVGPSKKIRTTTPGGLFLGP